MIGGGEKSWARIGKDAGNEAEELASARCSSLVAPRVSNITMTEAVHGRP